MTKTVKKQLDSHCFEHLKIRILDLFRASDFEFKNMARGVKLLRLTCLSLAYIASLPDRSF